MQIEEAQRLIQEKAGVAPPPPSNQTNPSMHQYGDVSKINNFKVLKYLLGTSHPIRYPGNTHCTCPYAYQ